MAKTVMLNDIKTPELKAACLNSQVGRAMIRAMGMQAENMQREALGQSMAYQYDSFALLLDEEGLSLDSIAELILFKVGG